MRHKRAIFSYSAQSAACMASHDISLGSPLAFALLAILLAANVARSQGYLAEKLGVRLQRDNRQQCASRGWNGKLPARTRSSSTIFTGLAETACECYADVNARYACFREPHSFKRRSRLNFKSTRVEPAYPLRPPDYALFVRILFCERAALGRASQGLSGGGKTLRRDCRPHIGSPT